MSDPSVCRWRCRWLRTTDEVCAFLEGLPPLWAETAKVAAIVVGQSLGFEVFYRGLE